MNQNNNQDPDITRWFENLSGLLLSAAFTAKWNSRPCTPDDFVCGDAKDCVWNVRRWKQGCAFSFLFGALLLTVGILILATDIFPNMEKVKRLPGAVVMIGFGAISAGIFIYNFFKLRPAKMERVCAKEFADVMRVAEKTGVIYTMVTKLQGMEKDGHRDRLHELHNLRGYEEFVMEAIVARLLQLNQTMHDDNEAGRLKDGNTCDRELYQPLLHVAVKFGLSEKRGMITRVT